MILLQDCYDGTMSKKVGAPLAKPVKAATVAPQTIYWRSRMFRGYVILASIGLFILGLAAHTIPYFSLDLSLTKFIQSQSWLNQTMVLISWPGYPPQVAIFIIASIIFLLILGLYWEALVGAIGFGVMELIVNLIKTWIGRVRPLSTLVNVAKPLSGGGFPSGHVVDYVVILGFFWFLVFTSFKKTLWLRSVLMILFGLMIFLVGPSRVYLGEHWPSDVLGAYLLGTILLWLLIEVYTWGKSKHLLRSAIK